MKTKIIAAAVAAATLLPVAAPTAADAMPYRHDPVSVKSGAKWGTPAAKRAKRKCYRRFETRTGIHRIRVKCSKNPTRSLHPYVRG